MSDPNQNDPGKQQPDPHVPIPERTGDIPHEDPSSPKPEITPVSPNPEIPAKPSRDVPKPDRERAENEGMISHPPPVPKDKKGGGA